MKLMMTMHKTTIMKTNELSGAALDWAVAKCEELLGLDNAEEFLRDHLIGFSTKYSKIWSQAGPIIERERISLVQKHDGWWMACVYNNNDLPTYLRLNQNPLVASMRCYVTIKIGDTVEIPKELLE